MPINAHPEYLAAEKEHLLAYTLEDKIKTLEKMISTAPRHKGAENLRAQLRLKLKKLKEKSEKTKSQKKSGKKTGIKKEDMQAVIIGLTNSGKSSLLNILTNASPEISNNENVKFTTKYPIIAMMNYSGVQIQIIENPAFESEFYDKGLSNSADTLIILITNLDQIKQIEQDLQNSSSKKIIVFNKSDKLSSQEKRKISANLQSRKYNFVIISTKNLEGIEELKNKLFQSFNKIRIYTKEPKKPTDKNKPIILNTNSTVKDVAEKILHGFSNNVKEARITGPSSKFPNQRVSINHIVKDLDVVEFKLK
jgi:ribosome-interacting GTPase 1